jgi:hypothetical protein
MIVFEAISCFLYFDLDFLIFFRGIAKKVAPFFVNVATLLQMSLEVIKFPLPTALGGNHFLWQRIRWYWPSSDKCVLFVKVANTSCQYPQRNVRGVAGTL